MEDEDTVEEAERPSRKHRSRGQVFISAELCKGCGYCVEFCPTHVLALSDGFNHKGYHTPAVVDAEACSGCGLCGMYCPDFAIFGIRLKSTGGEDEAA
jgi:2-oxoglutarate ferredoxin oxidoreductase subunit delta